MTPNARAAVAAAFQPTARCRASAATTGKNDAVQATATTIDALRPPKA
jgi:methylphosphotriester-DNA--protein-cysteine methyltransferase